MTLTDSEILARCAKRMGIHDERVDIPGAKSAFFDPLRDDAMAMAMVERFNLSVGYSNGWGARLDDERGLRSGAFHQPDHRRAICLCVANLP